MRRQRRSNTRGFLRKCQPPACQGVPVATTDRNVKDAVPGPEDGKHQADYRVGDTERENGRQNTTPGPCRTTMNLKQGRRTLPRTASKHFTDASFPGTWYYLRPWPRPEEHRAMPLWQRTQGVPSGAKKKFQRGGRCRVPRHETA